MSAFTFIRISDPPDVHRGGKILKPKTFIIIIAAIILITIWWFYSAQLTSELNKNYQTTASVLWRDRNGHIIAVKLNAADNYSVFQNTYPSNLQKLVLQKEDRFFYWHPGFNPISLLHATWLNLTNRSGGGASTITQQLAKILLHQENERNLNNKLKELIYALALETRWSKTKILTAYLNTIYLGNQTQGLNQASQLYFGQTIETLNDSQLLALIVTINNPSNGNPFTATNLSAAKKIAKQFNISLNESQITFSSVARRNAVENFRKQTTDNSLFELNDLGLVGSVDFSIDQALTTKLRELLKKELTKMSNQKAKNGAIVVLKQPENELLAIVGSPNPNSLSDGQQINLAIKARPIGSTVKPLIYLDAFQHGLRPYTYVDDQEYKYTINDGFAFYPKNYNYQYQGRVNLHYALSNSLNVPSLKILDYLGLDNLNQFFTDDLGLKPLQNIKVYQLSLALGGIEVEPLTMAYYFSLFSDSGQLKPLKTNYNNQSSKLDLRTDLTQNKIISLPSEVQLVNKILSDRRTGMDQFGQAGNLNLPFKNYAVKTGTSHDFHDSWTIGYTPDFTIAVWVGNSADTAMDELSGAAGAGSIWRQAMSLLYASSYNKNCAFDFSALTEYNQAGNLEYGLAGDNFTKSEQLLIGSQLILKPHDGDIFLLEPSTTLFFKSKIVATWSVDGKVVGRSENINWQPKKVGSYLIKADFGQSSESAKIILK